MILPNIFCENGMGATVEAPDGAEAYAYPHREAETGFNVLRGIRRPDDVDEAVSWARRATERTEQPSAIS